MAHLVTGYAGYAHVQSGDEGAFNASFFGGGQYAMEFGNCFEGSIIDNNTVRILDGEGLMYGRHFRIEPNSYEDMTIKTGTAGTNRIDLICMTYEKNAEDETERCYLQVIKGTETAGTAVVPEYTDGNILEGASFNQMPLYKVTIEGVVLKEIKPMFETIPTYKALAEYYAGVFQDRCDEILENLPIDALTPEDVVDNLLSESTNLPLSAKQGKVLNGKIDEQNKNREWKYLGSVADKTNITLPSDWTELNLIAVGSGTFQFNVPRLHVETQGTQSFHQGFYDTSNWNAYCLIKITKETARIDYIKKNGSVESGTLYVYYK